MKNFLITAFALCIACASCKKGNDNPTPANNGVDTCTRPAWSLANSYRTFSNPCGLALSPDGRVAVSEYNGGYGLQATVSVYKSLDYLLSNAGTADFSYPIAKAPEALAFDAAGNLYIAETEATAGVTILKKGSSYSYYFQKTIQSGFNNPRGMAFDAQGRLYLCDDGANRVLRFDDAFNSNAFTVILTGLGSPKGIAISGSDVYVAEYSGNRVSKWKLDDYAAPVSTVTLSHPVDVAANSCFVAAAQPEGKAVALFHSKLMSSSAGTYDIGGQVFGIALDAQSASLIVSAYDQDKVRQYK